MTPKQAKAAAIGQALIAIAEFYRVEPRRIISEEQCRGQVTRDARDVAVFYLYRQGLSWNFLSWLFKRSVDCVRKCEARGAIRMMGEDWEMLKALPRIPNTVEVAR